jgi:hypothetical protein
MSSPAGSIKPEAAARAVFGRLAPLVPRELDFAMSGAVIRLRDPSRVWSQMDCRVFFDDEAETKVEAARRHSFSSLASPDFVTEFLAEPWPASPPESPGLAPPEVVVMDEGIRLLYRTPSDPLLELPFVRWDELQG